MNWTGQTIRVEHVVAPGGYLTNHGRHIASCACRCAEVQICPRCGGASWVSDVKGRWDVEGGHTARPFDPVWVRLGCGCEFGDESLAEPPDSATPATSGGAQ